MRTLLIVFSFLICSACHRSDFLDAKPSSNLVIPSTVADYQGLLDNSSVMNLTPTFGALSTDMYVVDPVLWESSVYPDKALYSWAADIYQGSQSSQEWNLPFKQVFTANQVLSGLSKLPQSVVTKQLQGSAYFFRAHAFYQLSQTFCEGYEPATAASRMGLPLKLEADINGIKARSSLRDTYQQILDDLLLASSLLSVNVDPVNRNRPNKAAAFGLLARVMLVMQEFEKARLYADSCLQIQSTLIDYSSVPLTSERYFPFEALNEETLFQANFLNSNYWSRLADPEPDLHIEKDFAGEYSSDDLRHQVLFFGKTDSSLGMNGGYGGTIAGNLPFSGIAVNEVYLIKAECLARLGDGEQAMACLNSLLEKRYRPGSYLPIQALPNSDLLNVILKERRKELVFLERWADLRRLNILGRDYTLSRDIGGESFSLLPNSLQYVFPIPQEEISSSGITQNPR